MDNPYQAPSECEERFGPVEKSANKIRGGPSGDSQFLLKLLIFAFLFLAVLLGVAPFFMYLPFFF